MLKKLPDEIGHLQNLTSLGLIGNKLEYLPIPVTNLPLLRALWLTQNQSHPLVSFFLIINYVLKTLLTFIFYRYRYRRKNWIQLDN